MNLVPPALTPLLRVLAIYRKATQSEQGTILLFDPELSTLHYPGMRERKQQEMLL